ncbi:hypothetical protein NDI39_09885 [Microcoleus sp. ZQ-A2]|nr:hypothetical protein [Microcoleus sp. FACHB-1]
MPFAIHHGRTFSSIFRSIRQAFSSILTLLSTSRLASGELLASHGRTDLKERNCGISVSRADANAMLP